MSAGTRIALSRILAVNWYGYRQFIDVKGLTLITGANGSGKSALLDLIQFVMLGEQHSKFNKAAAGAGSGRNLRGYCLCDTNTTGRDGQERYLRPSSVTLAALEFSWPLQPGEAEPRRETWGARIEYEGPTAKPSTVWFRADRRLDWSDFLRADAGPQAMQFTTEEEFRTHVKRDLDGDAWDRQQTYREEMALRAHLGFDPEQMAKTLPRAMAFEPESNFEKFVRDFLLEPGMPDVRAVKASVDAHRRAQERLTKMHDQLDRLTQVSQRHEAWLRLRRESQLYAHLGDAMKHEEALADLRQSQATLEAERAANAENLAAHQSAIAERDRLQSIIDAASATLGGTERDMEQNKGLQEKLQADIARLQSTATTVREQLQERLRHWQDWMRLGAQLGLEMSDEDVTLFSNMKSHDEVRALDAARAMTPIYNRLKDTAMEHLTPLEVRLKEAESRKTALENTLVQLHEGQPAPAPLLNALRARGQKAVALGRVVEVKHEAEKWWPLLEAVLGPNRRAILPEDFAAAWNQALQTPSPTEPLIQPAELNGQAKPGSLRDMLETSHTDAARALDHLLGDIMPVKTAAQLEKHARALSADGWFKNPPHRVKLLPEKELTLGEEGLRRLRAAREEDLRAANLSLEELKAEVGDWRSFVNRGREWHLDHFASPPGSDELTRLPALKRELDQLRETWNLIATPDAVEKVESLRVQKATLAGVHERIGSLKSAITGFEVRHRQIEETVARNREAESQALFVRSTSRALVHGLSDAEIQQRIESERKSTTWRKAIEMAAALTLQRENESRESRRQRDELRRELISAHPELGEALDMDAEDNEAFDQRRHDLETHKLPEFREAAEAARKDWEDRLQHQVLDVLREKLAEADKTKRELNRAMDHEIGGWRYQLTSRADKAHTAIWTLVEKGLPSGEAMELFNAAGREDIERAKAELMAAIDAADNPEDKRHQRALDYRYYHHWDIEAKPAGRGDAAAISLNKSAKKQSGGENQAPFFVATLAAFRRVYDLGRRDDPQNLGLVVMDEAFSKLSGDRIDDCLALARNFGLQLVMAFPEDRLPTMFQHADTVVQCRVERRYDETTEQVQSIENWVVRVEGSRLAELME